MIVRLESYGMIASKEVVYLDTDKIWAFSFIEDGKRVVFKANGITILDRFIPHGEMDEYQFYLNQYKKIKEYLTGEVSEVYT